MQMIMESGQPTPEFRDMVADTVQQWLKHEEQVGNRTQWLVTAVQDRDGNETYWGLIDIVNTPREDLFIVIEQRFYCAYRTLGERNLLGMGLIDVRSVIGGVKVDLRDHLPPTPPPNEPLY